MFWAGTLRAQSREAMLNCSAKPGSEVFIVDRSSAAPAALGAHRPTSDSTYVLCRAGGEPSAEFTRRVLRRARQIRERTRIGSLWYVIGGDPAEPSGSVRLLESLLPLLESRAQLTLASPRSNGGVVFTWMDSLLGQYDDINMGVRFYPEASALRRVALAPSEQLQCA